MQSIWIIGAILVLVPGFFLGWRWTSRKWLLPCPSLFGWALESRFYGWLSGTEKTLQRMNLQAGQRILEIGPGPGRLLLSAAERTAPEGEAVGIEIQPGMVERLRQRAAKRGIKNLSIILGDAAQPHVEEQTFDLVFLVTTLGLSPRWRLLQCRLQPRIAPVQEAFLDTVYRSICPNGILDSIKVASRRVVIGQYLALAVSRV